jgi:hypothetical protein
LPDILTPNFNAIRPLSSEKTMSRI